MEPDFVGRAMNLPALDASARHPDAKPVGMMVAAIRALRTGRSTKLGGEHHDGFVQQAALFEVLY